MISNDFNDIIDSAFLEIMNQPIEKISHVGAPIAIPSLREDYLIDLCDAAIFRLKRCRNVLYLKSPINIVGDLHGNFHDLLRIFQTCGDPAKIPYLFLGDYVDRGNFSIETIVLLLLRMIQNPNRIFLLRGNHEFPDINGQYGFRQEILATYSSDELWYKFNQVFTYLPIAAVIDNDIFCVHGGLTQGFASLKQIECAPKPMTNENMPKLIKGLLWSDPSRSVQTFAEGNRGFGEVFGQIAIDNFFQASGMKLLIRAHQCVKYGSSIFNQNCITVFSSSGYANQNDAAVLLLNSISRIETFQFSQIPHPKRIDAIFFSAGKLKKVNSSSPLALTFLIHRSNTKQKSNKIRRMSYSHTNFEHSLSATELLPSLRSDDERMNMSPLVDCNL